MMRLRVWLWLGAFALAAGSPSALACAVCYGQPESPLARGMTWGVSALLVMVMTVLSGIAAFFVSLARRAETAERDATAVTGPVPKV